MRLCPGCRLEKPGFDFPKKPNKSGRKCLRCLADYQQAWRERNPDKKQMPRSYFQAYQRDVGRFAKFGITRGDFDQLWQEQGGRCAICSDPFTDASKVAIDHDHECCSGRANACGRCVRGLLCSNCNTAIGLLKDSRDRLLSAIQYLEQWGDR